MTVVVADSSPLNYLTLIGSVDVLHRLYGTVVVPQQVITESIDPAAPHEVRGWALNLPDWIDVRVAVVNDDTMVHLDHPTAAVHWQRRDRAEQGLHGQKANRRGVLRAHTRRNAQDRQRRQLNPGVSHHSVVRAVSSVRKVLILARHSAGLVVPVGSAADPKRRRHLEESAAIGAMSATARPPNTIPFVARRRISLSLADGAEAADGTFPQPQALR